MNKRKRRRKSENRFYFFLQVNQTPYRLFKSNKVFIKEFSVGDRVEWIDKLHKEEVSLHLSTIKRNTRKSSWLTKTTKWLIQLTGINWTYKVFFLHPLSIPHTHTLHLWRTTQQKCLFSLSLHLHETYTAYWNLIALHIWYFINQPKWNWLYSMYGQ